MTLPIDVTTLAVAAGALFTAVVLAALMIVGHATSYSRGIDRRRVRRARFQDEWSEIIQAAADVASANRRSK